MHIGRQFRESQSVMLLKRQRFGIFNHMCDDCKTKNMTNSNPVQIYENEYLTLILNCKSCLENNIALANTHYGHFPALQNLDVFLAKDLQQQQKEGQQKSIIFSLLLI